MGGKIQSVGPMKAHDYAYYRDVWTTRRKTKGVQHEKSSTFSGEKVCRFQPRWAFVWGESEGSHGGTHNFCLIPFCCLKKICMHIAYRNRNRDLIYRVSGHFGFAIARTTRSPKSQRCLWKFWWANQRVIIFTSKWSEKKVAARWGWLAPTSAESQIRSFKFTLSPIIMEAESP